MLTDATLEVLLTTAWDAKQHARAKVSGFCVGAAVLTNEGQVVPGANIEASNLSLTCCAERVAVFSALSQGAKGIVAVAVHTDASPPAAPCGACRQVLMDYGGPQTQVTCSNSGGEVVTFVLSDLLPHHFGFGDLE